MAVKQLAHKHIEHHAHDMRMSKRASITNQGATLAIEVPVMVFILAQTLLEARCLSD